MVIQEEDFVVFQRKTVCPDWQFPPETVCLKRLGNDHIIDQNGLIFAANSITWQSANPLYEGPIPANIAALFRPIRIGAIG